MDKICQSCAMPLVNEEEIATNADGSKNENYCIHCYKDGAFANDYTMEEMVEVNLKYLNQWNEAQGINYTVEEARKILLEMFPNLERWKK